MPPTHDFKAEARKLVSQMTLGEKIAQMRYDAPAIERLGIPAYDWWNEALHGVARCGTATVFPQAIGMAASFHPQLLREVGDAVSTEVRAKYNEFKTFGGTQIYEGLTCWAPNINIFRDPRWGRGQETYGEDPFLTGTLGTAYVKGLQGDDPDYRKVDATLKHFAVHSGPEATRHSANIRVSKKDLWETYLAAFAMCIRDAGPAAVMGAYNRVNDEPACASKTLLQDILRKELGFQGYVVSDCGAIADIHEHHHLTKDAAESSALAVKNGCQLNCGQAYAALVAACAGGLIDEETITRAVELLFEARLRLGLLSADCPYDAIPPEVIECEAHRALNRRIADESLVLLKNNGILPLDPGKTLAVVGPNADDVSVLLGNYNGTPSRYWTFLRGIQEAAEKVIYAKGCDIDTLEDEAPGSWDGHKSGEALLAARRADAVVLFLGLNPSMEGEETPAHPDADKHSLDLPECQLRLFRKLVKEGKPIICVNVSGSCVDLTEIDRGSQAVIQCFYPGAEGGHALADVLFGKVNPSGRLPVTFYHSTSELPPFTDYSMKGRTYRYFQGTPLYPFGHGLSYTTFRYENLLAAKQAGGGCALRLRLTNTGVRAGAEVIQAYMRPVASRPEDPIRKLVALDKIFLVPGEAKDVELPIPADAFVFYADDGERILRTDDMAIAVGPLEIICAAH